MTKPLLYFYLAGVAVTLLLDIVGLLTAISIMLSMRAKNLKKIGLHYSISDGKFIDEPMTFFSAGFAVLDLLVITPLLSWLPAIRVFWYRFRAHATKMAIPEKIKEMQFQLANVDLPRTKVEKLMTDIRRLAASYGSPDTSEEFLDGNSLEIDQYNEMMIAPSQSRVRHRWHSPDYESTGEAIYEYRIDGFDVFTRTIEEFKSEYGLQEKNVYSIKDNVVLESDIRERAKSDKFVAPLGETVDTMIEKLRNQTAWNKLPTLKMKYFIISRHSFDFEDDQYKTYIRRELERIRTGKSQVEQFVSEKGYTVRDTEFGTVINVPEGIDDATSEQLRRDYKEIIPVDIYSSNGITESEFRDSTDLIEFLAELVETKE